MKLFYKGDYKRVLDKLNEQTKEFEKLKKQYDELYEKHSKEDYKFLESYHKYENLYLQTLKTNSDLRVEVDSFKKKNKELRNSKGGLKTRVNNLLKQIEELNQKITERAANEYVVREIPSGRLPNPQRMKIKSSSRQSSAIKLVKEKC